MSHIFARCASRKTCARAEICRNCARSPHAHRFPGSARADPALHVSARAGFARLLTRLCVSARALIPIARDPDTKKAFHEHNAHPVGICFFKRCIFKDIWIFSDFHFRTSKEAAERSSS